MFKNKIILKILNYYKDLWALGYTSAIAHWDMETYMPSKGIEHRAEGLGRIATIKQRFFLNKEFVGLIHKAYGIKQLTDQEKGVIRILTRSLKFYEKLPKEFIEEFEKLTNTATLVWRRAKETENYKLFEPYLIKIFEMNRKMAECLGYKDSPYDALLDLFEEGLTVSVVEPFFDEIKHPLQKLIRHDKPHFLENAKYDREKLKSLNQKILKSLWPDFGKNFRIDESAHPFTTSFSNSDTRITTWYHEHDFGRSLLATIHEFGHALYDMQSAPELEMTPIAGGSSLVIHESQSRFWENHVGRSKDFIKNSLDDLMTVVNKTLRLDDVYSYFNRISPGLLRVEADEVTYHFHIMLRYEIEKGIIENEMRVRDLREIWNVKMKDYLGIAPKKDNEGVLQDIHWSQGMVGYFPTYSLGTFLAAQWRSKMLNAKSQMLNYDKTKAWLRRHIHKYGSAYRMQDLLKKNKMKFDPRVNLNYLSKKYL